MIRTVVIAIASIALVCAIIVQPDAAFKASLQGLTVWWNIVFPGLLPFLVILEMMSAFGLVHALGVLLRPLTNRLFKLPGEAGLAIAVGWMSGFPAGAYAAAKLRRSGAISAKDGERLLAIAHMPNPIFMIVVFGAGFLHRPPLGLLLAASVWLAGLWTALLLALTAGRKAKSVQTPGADKRPGLWSSAAQALREGRRQDGRTFGQVLGESVTASVQKLMTVGGLMIIASVLIKLVSVAAHYEAGWVQTALPVLIESHLGAYAAAVPLIRLSGTAQIALAGAALAWSGFSGILLAGQAVAGTGLRMLPLMLAKLLHAAHAFLFAFLLWKPAEALFRLLAGDAGGSNPAFAPAGASSSPLIGPGPVTAAQLPSLWPYALAGALILAAVGAAVALLLLPWRDKASY